MAELTIVGRTEAILNLYPPKALTRQSGADLIELSTAHINHLDRYHLDWGGSAGAVARHCHYFELPTRLVTQWAEDEFGRFLADGLDSLTSVNLEAAIAQTTDLRLELAAVRGGATVSYQAPFRDDLPSLTTDWLYLGPVVSEEGRLYREFISQLTTSPRSVKLVLRPADEVLFGHERYYRTLMKLAELIVLTLTQAQLLTGQRQQLDQRILARAAQRNCGRPVLVVEPKGVVLAGSGQLISAKTLTNPLDRLNPTAESEAFVSGLLTSLIKNTLAPEPDYALAMTAGLALANLAVRSDTPVFGQQSWSEIANAAKAVKLERSDG